MASIKLDNNDWDLDVDKNNDIAVTDEGGQTIAQDVSTAVRVWLGESYFDTSFGVAYKEILAQNPLQSFVASLIGETAKTVKDVETIKVELNNWVNDPYDKSRVLTGVININGEYNVSI